MIITSYIYKHKIITGGFLVTLNISVIRNACNTKSFIKHIHENRYQSVKTITIIRMWFHFLYYEEHHVCCSGYRTIDTTSIIKVRNEQCNPWLSHLGGLLNNEKTN